MPLNWALPALCLAVAGCQCGIPDLGQAKFPCSTDADCVPGFRCVTSVCTAEGTGGAGGMGGGGTGGATGGGDGLGGGSGGATGGGNASGGGTPMGGGTGTGGNVNPADHLSFAVAPSSTYYSQVALAVQPQVLVLDALGQQVDTANNPVTLATYTDAACTVASSAVVRPATPVTADGGLATFDKVSLEGTSSLYLGASSPGLTLACSSQLMPGATLFTDVASNFGVVDSTSGSYGWAAVSDIDNNGLADLALGSSGKPKLFLHLAALTWQDAPLPADSGDRSVVFGDCDNDGFRDLFVTSAAGGHHFYRNVRDGGFIDETALSALTNNNAEGAAVLDYDRDGLLDYVSPDGTTGSMNLWRNTGDCVFTNTTATAGLPTSGLGNGEQVVAIDFDQDGDVDLFYAVAQNRDGGGLLRAFRNNGDGTFTDVSTASGLGAAAALDYRAGLAFGDYDNDGDFDLFIGRNNTKARSLFRQNGNHAFAKVTGTAGDLLLATTEAEGATFGDFDNDGLLDLYVAGNNTTDKLFRAVSVGSFVQVTASGLTDVGADRDSTGVATCDNNHDGDLDVFVNNRGASASHFYRNNHGGPNYLKVKVRGRGAAGGHPVDGTGAVVQLFDETGTVLRATREVSGGAAMGQNDPIVHFGLAASWGGASGRYVVKVLFGSGPFTRPGTVTPSKVMLTVGGTVMNNTLEVVEP